MMTILTRKVVLLLTALLASGISTNACAWWDTGHKHITVGAIEHLPLPLRGFFEQNLAAVRDMSGQEPPGAHYIDIDLYAEFFNGTFPRDVNALIAIYGNSTVTSRGRGPWTFANYVQTLTAGMAAATTLQDWQALLPTAAAQAHYIEDLHNPLHLTANYNGQLTGNTGIHARYEGQMIEFHLDELEIVDAEAIYLPSVIDYVFDGIEEHYPFVDEIMAADDLAPIGANYYNVLWQETGDFTYNLFQEASVAVASSWYTAWINAGSPKTFLEYSADFNADGRVSDGDLLEWQQAYGVNSSGDADGDGDTDGHDFLFWQRQYGNGMSSLVSNTSVPEPTSFIMVAIACVAFCAKRCRQQH